MTKGEAWKKCRKIEKTLNEDSDSEPIIGGRPEECSNSEIISNCEDPVTLDSDDNDCVDSDTQASSSKSEDEHVIGPSQPSFYGKNKY